MLSAQENAEYFLYVGTYGDGVHAFRFHPDGPKFEPLGMVGALPNPSWVITDSGYRYLYAASELLGTVEGAVAAFAIDRKTGRLKLLNSIPSGGVAPCHQTLDNDEKALLVANYTTGEVCTFPLEADGRIGPLAHSAGETGCGTNPKRQECPHAHCAVMIKENNIVYVADLGLDRIRLYRFDETSLKLNANDPDHIQLDAGFGPRHLVFSPDAKFMYVLNELGPRVTVLTHDTATGRMNVMQTVATLPTDFSEENSGAEIVIDRDGRYLYTSNRGHDSIQAFAIDKSNATLSQIQVAKIAGKTPRGMGIDPSGRYLVVGGQDSNSIEFFRIEAESGRLTPGGVTFETPSPVDFKWVPVA